MVTTKDVVERGPLDGVSNAVRGTADDACPPPPQPASEMSVMSASVRLSTVEMPRRKTDGRTRIAALVENDGADGPAITSALGNKIQEPRREAEHLHVPHGGATNRWQNRRKRRRRKPLRCSRAGASVPSNGSPCG